MRWARSLWRPLYRPMYRVREKRGDSEPGLSILRLRYDVLSCDSSGSYYGRLAMCLIEVRCSRYPIYRTSVDPSSATIGLNIHRTPVDHVDHRLPKLRFPLIVVFAGLVRADNAAVPPFRSQTSSTSCPGEFNQVHPNSLGPLFNHCIPSTLRPLRHSIVHVLRHL